MGTPTSLTDNQTPWYVTGPLDNPTDIVIGKKGEGLEAPVGATTGTIHHDRSPEWFEGPEEAVRAVQRVYHQRETSPPETYTKEASGNPAFDLGRATAVVATDPTLVGQAQQTYEAWSVNPQFMEGWDSAQDWAALTPAATKQMYVEEFASLRQALGHKTADADNWYEPAFGTTNTVDVPGTAPGMGESANENTLPHSAPNTDSHWLYLNGKVAFGGHYWDLAQRLGDQLGLDSVQTRYISNSVARNSVPQEYDVAIGEMNGSYPQVWKSSIDRNAVFDAVVRAWDAHSAPTPGKIQDPSHHPSLAPIGSHVAPLSPTSSRARVSVEQATQRLFLAFDLPTDAYRELETWRAPILAQHPEFRPETHLHVTLAFVGDSPPERIQQLEQAIQQMGQTLPMPNFGQPVYEELDRLGWIRWNEMSNAAEWFNQISQHLAQYGWTTQFPNYLAHTTLWRYDAAPGLQVQPPAIQWTAVDCAVYQSTREFGYQRVAAPDLRLIPGGGQGTGTQFVRGDFVTGAPGSGREGMKGYIQVEPQFDEDGDLDEGYGVQWYPVDSLLEWRHEDELLPWGFTGPRAASQHLAAKRGWFSTLSREGAVDYVKLWAQYPQELTEAWTNNKLPRLYKPGDRALFEYHCFQSEESCDAELWHHTQQPCTIIGYGDDDEASAIDRGGASYVVRFKDGFEGPAMQDELVTRYDRENFGWQPGMQEWKNEPVKVECPLCYSPISYKPGGENSLVCPNCGWTGKISKSSATPREANQRLSIPMGFKIRELPLEDRETCTAQITYLAHVLDVNVVWDDKAWEGYGTFIYERPGSPNQHSKRNTVFARTISTDFDYICAMHELGHVAFKHTYGYAGESSQEEEAWAWHWMIENKLSGLHVGQEAYIQAQKMFNTYVNTDAPQESEVGPGWLKSYPEAPQPQFDIDSIEDDPFYRHYDQYQHQLPREYPGQKAASAGIQRVASGEPDPDYFYHVAPSADRARIQVHGLQPADPMKNPEWQGLSRQPEGVYVMPNLESAQQWVSFYQHPTDIWRVPRDQVRETEKDPILTSATIIKHPVWPDLHLPYEWQPHMETHWDLPEADDDPNFKWMDNERWRDEIDPDWYGNLHRDSVLPPEWGIGQPTGSIKTSIPMGYKIRELPMEDRETCTAQITYFAHILDTDINWDPNAHPWGAMMNGLQDPTKVTKRPTFNAKPIETDMDYMVALHELGHLAFLHQYGAVKNSVEEEQWAWHWAIENKLSEIHVSQEAYTQAQRAVGGYHNEGTQPESPANIGWMQSYPSGWQQQLKVPMDDKSRIMNDHSRFMDQWAQKPTYSKVARYVDVQLVDGKTMHNLYLKGSLGFDSDTTGFRDVDPNEAWLQSANSGDQMNVKILNAVDPQWERNQGVVGSIMYTEYEQETRVLWLYVDPNYRDSNVFSSLVKPVIQIGKPLTYNIINPKLQQVADKWQERAAKPSDQKWFCIYKDGEIATHWLKTQRPDGGPAMMGVCDYHYRAVHHNYGDDVVIPGGELRLPMAPFDAGVPAESWKMAQRISRLGGFQVWTADIHALAEKQRQTLLSRPDVVEWGRQLWPVEQFQEVGRPPKSTYLKRFLDGMPDEGFKLMPWVVREFKQDRIVPSNWAHAHDLVQQAVRWMQWAQEHHKPSPDYMSKQFGLRQLQEWVYEMNAKDVEEGSGWKDSKPVYKYSDGWTMDLVGAADLAKEGELMGHCVGGYCDVVNSGNSSIYSLRDPKGHPHVTIEVSGAPDLTKENPSMHSDLTVIQVQGKQDTEPIPEYRSKVDQWFEHLGDQGYQVDEENPDREPDYEYEPHMNGPFTLNDLDEVEEYHNIMTGPDKQEHFGEDEEGVWEDHTITFQMPRETAWTLDDVRQRGNELIDSVLRSHWDEAMIVKYVQGLWMAVHHLYAYNGRYQMSDPNAADQWSQLVTQWHAYATERSAPKQQWTDQTLFSQDAYDLGQKAQPQLDAMFGLMERLETAPEQWTETIPARRMRPWDENDLTMIPEREAQRYLNWPGRGEYPETDHAKYFEQNGFNNLSLSGTFAKTKDDWRMAGMTRPQELRQWQNLHGVSKKYQPHHETVHEFPNGWSVRRATTPNDVHMIGKFMRNCWQDHDPESLGGKMSDGYHALFDPEGLPRVAFYEHGGDWVDPGSKWMDQPLGMRNGPISQEHQDMLLDYGKRKKIRPGPLVYQNTEGWQPATGPEDARTASLSSWEPRRGSQNTNLDSWVTLSGEGLRTAGPDARARWERSQTT